MKKNGYLKKISILFFIGLIGGVLCAYLWKESYVTAYQEYFSEMFSQLEGGKIRYGVLYLKAVKQVMLCYFILILCCCAGLFNPATIIFTGYQGYHFGFLIGSLIFTYGIKGTIYGVTYGFPHMIIYGFVMFFLLFQGYKKKNFKELPALIGILGILLLIGAALETFINSWIMGKIIFLLK